MKLRISLAVVAVLVVAGQFRFAKAIDIRTDATAHAQRFEAWGTSLAWMGNELGSSSTNAIRRTQMMDMLFDQDNGLGLNFVRYNIGAGQNPNGPAITRPGADMDGWVPNAPTSVEDTSSWQWDWNADATQRLILDMAIERGVTQVEAFANSAPWWMTENLSSRGQSGQNLDPGDTGDEDNPGNYDEFGHYLLEVTEHFENNLGIHFHTLAPMNEPGTGFWNGQNNQEGMNVPRGGRQSSLIREIGRQIESRGLAIGLVGPEETSTRDTATSLSLYGSTTRSYLSQINTHTYSFAAGSDLDDVQALVNRNNTYTEPFKIYATEFGTGGNSTPVNGGIRLANRITMDLNVLGAAGWTYWQAVEDNNGSNWGLLIAPFDGSNNSFDTRRQYYTMKQFSQHIRPGAQILHQTDEEVVASYDPRTGTTTLVITNDETDTADTRTFDLLDQTAFYGRVIRTSDSEIYESLGPANLNPTGTQLTVESPASTITTVQLHHRPNLIQNPNFDPDGASNGATSIPHWESEGNAVFDTGSDHTFDGSGSGRLETNSGANSGSLFQAGIGSPGADLTGVAFQLSLDVRFLSGGSRSYRADTYLGIEFYGADDQTLAHMSIEDFETLLEPAYSVNSDSHNDNEYRTYQSGRFVAPAGTRYVRPIVRFDNVQLGATDWSFVDNAYLQIVHPEADGKEWAIAGSGDWDDDRAWLGHSLVERNKHVYFGNAIEQNSTVTLDHAVALEGITFFSEHEYQLQGSGTLQLGHSDSVSPVSMDVRLGSHSVTVGVELTSPLELQVLPGASLAMESTLDLNGWQLTKLGAGILHLPSGLVTDGGTLASYATTTATLSVGENAQLQGDFKLLLAPGQEVQEGDIFELMTYASLNETFDNLLLPTLPEGLMWQVDYGSVALTALAVAATLPGDFNADGLVDVRDFSIWRDQLGADESALHGNGDGNNVVDEGDYLLWKQNVGATAANESVRSASVPEPRSILLLLALICKAVLLCRVNSVVCRDEGM